MAATAQVEEIRFMRKRGSVQSVVATWLEERAKRYMDESLTQHSLDAPVWLPDGIYRRLELAELRVVHLLQSLESPEGRIRDKALSTIPAIVVQFREHTKPTRISPRLAKQLCIDLVRGVMKVCTRSRYEDVRVGGSVLLGKLPPDLFLDAATPFFMNGGDKEGVRAVLRPYLCNNSHEHRAYFNELCGRTKEERERPHQPFERDPRDVAIEVLSNLQAPCAVKPLVLCIADSSLRAIRESAMRALSTYPNWKSSAEAQEGAYELSRRYNFRTYHYDMVRVLGVLCEILPIEAVTELLMIGLVSSDARIRDQAIEFLALYTEKNVVVGRLMSTLQTTRVNAGYVEDALGRLRVREAIEPMVSAYVSGHGHAYHFEKVLGQIDPDWMNSEEVKSAASQLYALLEHPSSHCFRVVDFLLKIKDERAIVPMTKWMVRIDPFYIASHLTPFLGTVEPNGGLSKQLSQTLLTLNNAGGVKDDDYDVYLRKEEALRALFSREELELASTYLTHYHFDYTETSSRFLHAMLVFGILGDRSAVTSMSASLVEGVSTRWPSKWIDNWPPSAWVLSALWRSYGSLPFEIYPFVLYIIDPFEHNRLRPPRAREAWIIDVAERLCDVELLIALLRPTHTVTKIVAALEKVLKHNPRNISDENLKVLAALQDHLEFGIGEAPQEYTGPIVEKIGEMTVSCDSVRQEARKELSGRQGNA